MKIGDKVRFLSEMGGGRVAGFQGKNIVLVEDEDGFQIPTQISEVVLVETDNYDTEHMVQKKQEKKPTFGAKPVSTKHVIEEEEPADKPVTFRAPAVERKGGDKLSVYLAYVPVDIHEVTRTQFETYLVNDSNYYIHYLYLVAEGNAWQMHSSGEIEPNTKLFIEDFGREVLNEMEHVCVQFVAYKRDKSFLLKCPVEAQFRIDGVKFYKLHTFQENDFFEQKALLYTVIENDKVTRPFVVDAKQIKDEMFKSSVPADHTRVNHDSYVRRYEKGKGGNPFLNKQRGDAPVVVDLHANELLETTMGMSAGDILNYQLDVMRKTLAEYAGNKGMKIVFIHGKGEGVLRKAIIHELNYRYKQYPYQDASFQEYGYGATQVTIK